MAHIITRTSETGFQARAEFATLAEAQAFADSFPKSYLVKVGKSGGANGVSFWASCRYGFRPATGNDFNEVGAQRATRFMDKAEKLGHTIEHK